MTRTMLDGIASDASAMARSGRRIDLVAGYVDGAYAWSPAHWALFPNSVHVPIAVFASTNDGVVLDCEPGNCTPAQSVDWVLMRRRAGVDPTVYCNQLDPDVGWPAVRAAFHARGVAEPHYWVANYSVDQANPQIPAGAIALQYADKGPYDLSVVGDHWPGVDAAPASSPLEAPMQDALYAINPGPRGEQAGIWLYADGRYWHVPDLPTRDAIVAKLGIAEKPLDYAVHQVLLALTAPAAPVDVKALAASVVTALGPVVQQAVASGVQPDYDHMAAVLEAHLAATFAAGK